MVEQSMTLPRRNSLTSPVIWSTLLAHRWFILAAALVVGAGAWQGARLILGPAVVVDSVRRGNLVESVVASGHVETPYRVEIGSQITGTVDDVLVKEGERVSKGQPLISLEARELKAAVVQAQGAVAQAQARMRQLDELTLPSAREALAQARANLDTAESRLAYATITTPRDGVLITRGVERGTVAQPGKTLLVPAPTGELQLVLQIDERNLGKIALGQKALASADAYPDRRFAATDGSDQRASALTDEVLPVRIARTGTGVL